MRYFKEIEIVTLKAVVYEKFNSAISCCETVESLVSFCTALRLSIDNEVKIDRVGLANFLEENSKLDDNPELVSTLLSLLALASEESFALSLYTANKIDLKSTEKAAIHSQASFTQDTTTCTPEENTEQQRLADANKEFIKLVFAELRQQAEKVIQLKQAEKNQLVETLALAKEFEQEFEKVRNLSSTVRDMLAPLRQRGVDVASLVSRLDSVQELTIIFDTDKTRVDEVKRRVNPLVGAICELLSAFIATNDPVNDVKQSSHATSRFFSSHRPAVEQVASRDTENQTTETASATRSFNRQTWS